MVQSGSSGLIYNTLLCAFAWLHQAVNWGNFFKCPQYLILDQTTTRGDILPTLSKKCVGPLMSSAYQYREYTETFYWVLFLLALAKQLYGAS